MAHYQCITWKIRLSCKTLASTNDLIDRPCSPRKIGNNKHDGDEGDDGDGVEDGLQFGYPRPVCWLPAMCCYWFLE